MTRRLYLQGLSTAAVGIGLVTQTRTASAQEATQEVRRAEASADDGSAPNLSLDNAASDESNIPPDRSQAKNAVGLDSWPMFQRDSRNSSWTTDLNVGTNVAAEWTFDADRPESDGSEFGNGGKNTTGIIVDTNRAYVGKGKAFFALEKDTGDVHWAHSFDHPGTAQGTPCVGENAVYFASEYRDWDSGALVDSRGWVTAVDKSGKQLWRTDVGGTIRSRLTLSNNRLFFGTKPGTTSGRVEVLDAATGERAWNKRLGYGVFATPSVLDGTIYVIDSAPEGTLRALDVEDGNEQWTFSVEHAGQHLSDRCGGPCFTRSSPTVVDDTVYCGSHGQYVYAVNARSGQELWRFETDGRVGGSVAVDDDTAYAVAAPPNENDSATVHAARNGEQRWKYALDANVGSPPAVVGESVLVGKSSGQLMVLDRKTGREKWQFDVPDDGWVTSPAIVDGSVFISSQSGTVYRLQSSSTPATTSSETPQTTTFPSDTELTEQQGENPRSTTTAPEQGGSIPVLNRFNDSDTSLGIGLLIGLVGGGGGFALYRRQADDGEQRPRDQQNRQPRREQDRTNAPEQGGRPRDTGRQDPKQEENRNNRDRGDDR
jgi:outer membrane protein assembly factor BamB